MNLCPYKFTQEDVEKAFETSAKSGNDINVMFNL